MVKAPLQKKKAADRTIRLPTEAERCRQKKKGVDRRRRLLREEESCRLKKKADDRVIRPSTGEEG